MKRPSGAECRFRARLFYDSLHGAVELGALSPGLAAHFRRYGFSREALCTYVAGLQGQRRGLEPAEVVRQRQEMDAVEAALRRLKKEIE